MTQLEPRLTQRVILPEDISCRARPERGDWEARKMVGGRSHSATGATKDEARAAWLRWFYGGMEPQQASRGNYPTGSSENLPPPKTVNDLFDRWLPIVKQTLARRTYETYRDDCRLHLRGRFGDVRLSRLSRPVVQPYFEELKAGNTPTTTIARHKTTLQSAVRYAIENEWLIESPLRGVKTPTPEARVNALETYDEEPPPKWIPTFEEVRCFLEASVARNDPLFPLWLTGWTIGLRPAELVALADDCLVIGPSGRFEQLDVRRQLSRDRPDVILPAEERPENYRPWRVSKCKRGSARTIFAPRETIDALKGQINKMRGVRKSHPEWKIPQLLFRGDRGEPIDPATLTDLFHTRCGWAGIQEEDAYTMRHFCLSSLLDRGVPIKRVAAFAGHKRVSTLEKTYAHIIRKRAEDAAEVGVFGDLLGRGFGAGFGSTPSEPL